MEANLENLKKALTLVAQAHNSEFKDFSDEGELAIRNDNVPTVSDVQMVCDAFYGNHKMVRCVYGYTTFFIDDYPFLDSVDEITLGFALPRGWDFAHPCVRELK